MLTPAKPRCEFTKYGSWHPYDSRRGAELKAGNMNVNLLRRTGGWDVVVRDSITPRLRCTAVTDLQILILGRIQDHQSANEPSRRRCVKAFCSHRPRKITLQSTFN